MSNAPNPHNVSSNPFEAPIAEAVVSAHQGAPAGTMRREGNQLVVGHNAVLPPFCVKSNQPAEVSIKRKFFWHHPAVYFAILAHPIIYVILALVLRKQMLVMVPLSAAEAAKRKSRLWIVRSMMVLCIPVIIGSFVLLANEQIAVGLSALIVGFIALAGFAVANNKISCILKPKKITDDEARLLNSNPEFLNRLPS